MTANETKGSISILEAVIQRRKNVEQYPKNVLRETLQFKSYSFTQFT